VAKNKAQGGSNLKPFYIILGLVALAGIIFIAFGSMRRQGVALEPVALDSLDARALLEKAKGVTIGEGGNTTQILVFSDYMCPACAVFNSRIFPLIKQEFVDKGQAQVIYYDFPLGGSHVHSFVAARAGRCAEDQGRFWPYKDMLLARQQDWSYSREAPIGKFVDYARELGLDADRFESCVRSDAHAELVSANRELGDQIGVGGTPTVFINGRRAEAWSDWNELRPLIQSEIGN
jgi:protein-disulfide isomerase